MALGADRTRVLKLVLRGAFAQIGIGLLIGIPATIAAGYAMTTQLFGVRPYSPGILLVTTLVLRPRRPDRHAGAGAKGVEPGGDSRAPDGVS